MGYHCMVHLDQTGHHQFIHPHIIQYESHTFDISFSASRFSDGQSQK